MAILSHLRKSHLQVHLRGHKTSACLLKQSQSSAISSICTDMRSPHMPQEVSPILTTSIDRLGQETGDTDQKNKKIYGPIDTQSIASNEFAETIADSYVWFANEAFWSAECKKTYGKPQKGDDVDPNCSDQACQDKLTTS